MKRLLFLGDSIAAETTMSFVPMVVKMMSSTVRISSDSENSSAPSSNVLDLLDRAQELLPLQKSRFDAACIFVGINDSKKLAQFQEALVPLDFFRHRLETLTSRLEGVGTRVVLCGLPDLDFGRITEGQQLKDYWYWDVDEYHAYTATIRDLAVKGDGHRLFVDLEEAFASASAPRGDLFGPDGVHPSPAGHTVIATAVTPAMIDAVNQ